MSGAGWKCFHFSRFHSHLYEAGKVAGVRMNSVRSALHSGVVPLLEWGMFALTHHTHVFSLSFVGTLAILAVKLNLAYGLHDL